MTEDTLTIDPASPTILGELIVGSLASDVAGPDDPRLIPLAVAELRRLAEARGLAWDDVLADAQAIGKAQ